MLRPKSSDKARWSVELITLALALGCLALILLFSIGLGIWTGFGTETVATTR